MKKKKITIIGVNYFPENTSTGLYTTQLAEYLNLNDIEVALITGFPYYPAWSINKEYRSKKRFLKENINGITVLRYKQYVPSSPTFIKRIIHLLDFTFGSLVNVFKVKKTDVVLCIVPFTSSVFLGKILAKLRKAKLWVHIQDFEFDAAIDTMVANKKNSLFFKILFSVEKKLFNQADTISTISNSMLKKLDTKTVSKVEKLLLPNWVDVNTINPEKSKQHMYLQSEKFKVLYSGNIGEKQDWNFFIKVIKELQNAKDIEFVVVGDGAKRDWLQKQIKELDNVSCYSPVDYEELSDLLCSADLHVLFQKEDVKDTVMPSKMLAMMASEKPSLITGNIDSEIADIMRQSNAGKYFSNHDFDAIISFILELKANQKMSIDYGQNARKYVTSHFGYEQVLSEFKLTFNKLVSGFEEV